MEWRFVLKMGLGGMVLGGLSLLSWFPPSGELIGWGVLSMVWIIMTPRLVPKAPFSHVLLAGALAGLLYGDVQALWFDTYLAAHPQLADAVADQTANAAAEGNAYPARTLTVVGGIFTGLFFGTFSGLGAMLATRMRRAGERVQQEAQQGMAPLGAHMDVTHPERARADDSEE